MSSPAEDSEDEPQHLSLTEENPEGENVNYVKLITSKAKSKMSEHHIIATLNLRAGLEVKRIDLYIHIRNRYTRKITKELSHENVPYKCHVHSKYNITIPAIGYVSHRGMEVREFKLRFFFNDSSEKKNSISTKWLRHDGDSHRLLISGLAEEGNSHDASAAAESSWQRSVSSSAEDSEDESQHLNLTEENPEGENANYVKSVNCEANSKTSEHNIVATLGFKARLDVKRINLYTHIRDRGTKNIAKELSYESVPYKCRVRNKYSIAIPIIDPVSNSGVEVREFRLKFFFNDSSEKENSISTKWLRRKKNSHRLLASRLTREKGSRDASVPAFSRQRSMSSPAEDDADESQHLNLTEESPEAENIGRIISISCKRNKADKSLCDCSVMLSTTRKVCRVDVSVIKRRRKPEQMLHERNHENIAYSYCGVSRLSVKAPVPVCTYGVVTELKFKLFFNEDGERELSISSVWLVFGHKINYLFKKVPSN